MRTILSILLLMTLAATAACSGAGSDPRSQGGEVQCGPPKGADASGKPVCDKDCYWDGKECKPDRGIIVLQRPDPAAPTSTTSTTAPPASQ
jgi:hypothetical protein